MMPHLLTVNADHSNRMFYTQIHTRVCYFVNSLCIKCQWPMDLAIGPPRERQSIPAQQSHDRAHGTKKRLSSWSEAAGWRWSMSAWPISDTTKWMARE